MLTGWLLCCQSRAVRPTTSVGRRSDFVVSHDTRGTAGPSVHPRRPCGARLWLKLGGPLNDQPATVNFFGFARCRDLRGALPNLVSVQGRAGRDVLGESGVVAGGQGGQACLVGRPEQPVVVADNGVEILTEDAGGGEVDRVE